MLTAPVSAELPEITPENAEFSMRNLADELGLKTRQLFCILCVAVTGQLVGPPLFECMVIVRKEKTLERIQDAVAMLEEISE